MKSLLLLAIAVAVIGGGGVIWSLPATVKTSTPNYPVYSYSSAVHHHPGVIYPTPEVKAPPVKVEVIPVQKKAVTPTPPPPLLLPQPTVVPPSPLVVSPPVIDLETSIVTKVEVNCLESVVEIYVEDWIGEIVVFDPVGSPAMDTFAQVYPVTNGEIDYGQAGTVPTTPTDGGVKLKIGPLPSNQLPVNGTYTVHQWDVRQSFNQPGVRAVLAAFTIAC